MTLLVLMYHRARASAHGNSPEMLAAHLAHIEAHHHVLLPGEPLARERLNVCLSFDDGYYDFYARVYPVLRRLDLRALLAVPAIVLRERIEAEPAARLALESSEAFAHPSRGGFCTWGELEEMTASGHVQVAAHGFTHTRLDGEGSPLETEIDAPQTLLGARCAQAVESFVFPFGRFSPQTLAHSRRRYRYVFRIGGASNRRWDHRLLYRVDADRMSSPTALFSRARLMRYRARRIWNRLRGC